MFYVCYTINRVMPSVETGEDDDWSTGYDETFTTLDDAHAFFAECQANPEYESVRIIQQGVGIIAQ